MRKGSSGSWVIDADRTKVYGILVATDCFGGLWMVRMTDIIKDIQEEFNTMEVAFVNHLDETYENEEVMTQYIKLEECATSASTQSGVLLIGDDISASSTDQTKEKEGWLDEASSKEHERTAKCQHCSSETHDGPCPFVLGLTVSEIENLKSELENVKVEDEDFESEVERLKNKPTVAWNSFTNYTGGENMIWYCSTCNDGPIGMWQVSCQACGHRKCSRCQVEKAR
jgi:hypothetical protein